jgi:hypothetical protein
MGANPGDPAGRLEHRATPKSSSNGPGRMAANGSRKPMGLSLHQPVLGSSPRGLTSNLNRIVYILDGRPIAGTPDEVVRSDLLSRLYQTDVHVHTTEDGHRFVVAA